MKRTISLAGTEYEIQYGPEARDEIEIARDKGLWTCITSGMLRDQAAVVWAAIKHGNKKLTVGDVVELLQQSEEYDADLRRCYRALLATAPFGKRIDPREVDRLVGKDEDDEGKGAAVPAAT